MIITETEALESVQGPIRQTPVEIEEPAPAFRSLLSSAGRVQNTILSGGVALGAALERRQLRTRNQVMGLEDPDYNPMQDITGYERFARSFRDAESPDEVYAVKRRIDRELEDRRVLEAGGAAGVVAQLAAGVIDPINLVPIGGSVVRSLSLGRDVMQSAVRTAATGAAVATGAEVALQGSQVTRTAQESIVGIGATALLSGILGAAAPLVREMIPGLSARVSRELTLPDPTRPDPLAPGSIPLSAGDFGSAGAMAATQMEVKLKGALGVEKLVGFASPILRTVQSPSGAVRRAAVELAETPFDLADNAAGVATPIAVETRIKMWQAPLAQALVDLDLRYVEYRKGGGDLSFKGFKEEVGRAMRRGDEHLIAQVQQAAQVFRRKLFDPTKKHAIAVKLLPEDVQVIGADSYLSRVYNVEKISAQRGEFVETLVKWLKHDQGGDYYELKALAEQITDHILKTPEGRVPYEAVPVRRGPANERVLNVPDEMIEPWLESDIETVARFYARSIIPDIELSRSFGDPTMRRVISGIRDSYQDMIVGAKNEAERAQLASRRDSDITDLAAMRDRLRGTYGAPADPSGFFVRGARLVRNGNYLSLLGAMTESSIPDLARPVMVHGVLRTLRDGVLPLITNFRQYRLATEEAKRAGAALDMVLDSRAMELADVGDAYGRHSRFERGVQALTERFGKWALMAPWNAALKQFTSVITQHEILSAAVRGAGMSARELFHLAQWGISPEVAGRIAAEFGKHGERGSVWLANTRAWTDRDAIAGFRAALVKEADSTIVTVGVGDRPLWMSTELGKTVGQFKSFAFASTQRVLISGLQRRDMATLNGTLLSIALGMGVYGLKSRAAGRETSDDPAVWVREGVDRSGILGWLYEAGNISEKFTRGLIGPRAITGGELASRYASRGVFGALFGPTVGRVEDIAKATGAAVSGEFTESDVRALRRLLPFQNLFYLRWLFDQAQEGAAGVLVD